MTTLKSRQYNVHEAFLVKHYSKAFRKSPIHGGIAKAIDIEFAVAFISVASDSRVTLWV